MEGTPLAVKGGDQLPVPRRTQKGQIMRIRGGTSTSTGTANSRVDPPYCDYCVTVRVEIPNRPGQFARLATALAEENANLGAIDIVGVKSDRMVRDITFDAQSEAHANRVLERLRTLPEVRVLSASDRVFLMHLGGKIHTRTKMPVRTRNALSMAYTPGVARVSRAIAEDKSKVYAFTSKANSVAVVTDGSASARKRRCRSWKAKSCS
jgi:malate dehydrogenase (oxaloacetate-decarboxylating)